VGYLAEGTTYRGNSYDFDYWYSKVDSFDETYDDPFDCSSDLTSPPPASQPVVEVICHNNNARLTGNWNNINKIYTIFVKFDDPDNGVLELSPSGGITMSPSGNGLLTIVTNGSIKVGDNTTTIEGVYMADKSFSSCTSSECGVDIGDQLTVNGSVIAWGGVNLNRTLGSDNDENPAELFTYEVSYLDKLPDFFKISHMSWKEVAP
jgi:hypothetical protein